MQQILCQIADVNILNKEEMHINAGLICSCIYFQVFLLQHINTGLWSSLTFCVDNYVVEVSIPTIILS